MVALQLASFCAFSGQPLFYLQDLGPGQASGLNDSGQVVTFTVLTTFPNEVSGQVHDRMPVIVQPNDYQRWLDPENQDVADILATPPSEGWIAYPVSRRVNSPKNDDRKLIEPEPA